MAGHKLQDTPVEVLVDMVSDRGSIPLASTKICPKSLIFQAFRHLYGYFIGAFEAIFLPEHGFLQHNQNLIASDLSKVYN